MIGPNQEDATDPRGFSVDKTESGVTAFEAQSDQNFYNAILRSISANQVAFFRDRGWPDSILFSLFIEEMQVQEAVISKIACKQKKHEECKETALYKKLIKGAGTPSENKKDPFTYENDPVAPKNFLSFLQFSKAVGRKYSIDLINEEKKNFLYSECEQDANGKALISKNGPLRLNSQECEDLKGFRQAYALADAKSLDVTKLKKSMRVYKGYIYQEVPTRQKLNFVSRSDDKDLDAGCTVSTGDRSNVDASDQCSVKITLRSPNDMVYYLGELLRLQSTKEGVADLRAACGLEASEDTRFVISSDSPCRDVNAGTKQEDLRPLFWIERGLNVPGGISSTYHSGDLYSFELNDHRYWISDDMERRGRTMQYIALLIELFALQQEASDPPTVSVIQGATIR